MPTNRRYRSRRRKLAELIDFDECWLVDGVDLTNVTNTTRDEMRQLWFRYKSMLMAKWFAKNPPDTRPHAWWEFESPEPRKLIGGQVPASPPAVMFCGVPRFYPIPTLNPPVYESDHAYLSRLGLLTPAEIAPPVSS
jgi:hypothetical protein